MLIEPKKKYSKAGQQGVNWYLDGTNVEQVRYTVYRKHNREIAEEAYNKNIDLPGPLHVIVETSSLCNLRCGFCNRDAGMGRPQKNMEFDLFTKVLSQTADMKVHSMGLYALGEPFLNPDLRKMINYAKGAGIPLVDISTNGMFSMSEVVLGTSLNEIIVSLEADKETQERLRPGSSWDKITQNLENLWYQRKRGGYQWPIIRLQIIDLPENHDKIPRFIDWGLNYADTVYVKRLETMRANLGNHLISDDKAKERLKERVPCKLLWFTLTVNSDGSLAGCCHDNRCRSVIGNIETMTLKDAWLKLGEIRKRHRRGDYSDFDGLCRECLDWQSW